MRCAGVTDRAAYFATLPLVATVTARGAFLFGGMMEQIYHNYKEWEDYQNGMWRKLEAGEESNMLDKAIKFTGDHQEYGAWMIKVTERWPIACEHNLTNTSQNRKAWIGHAATCMAINCPEYITRKAWSYLTPKQQVDANRAAEMAIIHWEERNNGGSDAIFMF
jgi:hypothetical protein